MAIEKTQIVDALKNEGLDESLADDLSFENEEKLNGWIEKIKNFASFKPEMLDKLTPEQIIEMANKRQSKSLQSAIDSIKTNEKKRLEEERKKSHSDPDPKEIPENEEVDALKKKIAEMEEWKNKVEKERSDRELNQSIDSKKKSVMSALKSDGCNNDEVLEFVGLKLEVTKDSDIDDLKKEGKKIYDEKYKKLFGRSYIPGEGGNSHTNKNKPTKEALAVLESIKERNKNKLT